MSVEPTGSPLARKPVVYRIDGNDRLVELSPSWDEFAACNEAPTLFRELVLERSIWDFIVSDSTRMIYDIVFSRLRSKETCRLEFRYRCDSPDTIRYMRMEMVSRRPRCITLKSQVLREEKNNLPVVITANDTSYIKRCSLCLKLAERSTRIEFVQVEEFFSRHPGLKNQLSVHYGLCPECKATMLTASQQAIHQSQANLTRAILVP